MNNLLAQNFTMNVSVINRKTVKNINLEIIETRLLKGHWMLFNINLTLRNSDLMSSVLVCNQNVYGDSLRSIYILNSTFEKLTVSEGYIMEMENSSFHGHAMSNSPIVEIFNSSARIKNCNFSFNEASVLKAVESNFSVTNGVTIIGNNATVSLLHILNNSKLEVTSVIFENNSMLGFHSAICVQHNSSAVVSNATFLGNRAVVGAAVHVINSSSVSVHNSLFVNNIACICGCIYLHSQSISKNIKNSLPIFIAENSNFTGNVAKHGMGICIENSTYSEISNCKFYHNKAIDTDSLLEIDLFNKIIPTFPQLKFPMNPLPKRTIGGVLWAKIANVAISRCSFSQNKGGVIWSQNTTIRVNSSDFKSNSAIKYVMQILFANVIDVVNCTFKNFGLHIGVLEFVHSGYITISNSKFKNSHERSINLKYLFTVIVSYWNTYLLVENSEFKNLTCVNGRVITSGYSKITKLKGCTLESNNMSLGGVLLYLTSVADVTVEDCHVVGNSARLVENRDSQLVIRNVVILKNSCLKQQFKYQFYFLLSIKNNSYTELTGCIFERNLLSLGMYFNSSQHVILRDCKFISNNVIDDSLISAFGGFRGMIPYNNISVYGEFGKIVNTDFINNTLSHGVLFAVGGGYFGNCTFYNNYATSYLIVTSLNLEMNKISFVNNTASSGLLSAGISGFFKDIKFHTMALLQACKITGNAVTSGSLINIVGTNIILNNLEFAFSKMYSGNFISTAFRGYGYTEVFKCIFKDNWFDSSESMLTFRNAEEMYVQDSQFIDSRPERTGSFLAFAGVKIVRIANCIFLSSKSMYQVKISGEGLNKVLTWQTQFHNQNISLQSSQKKIVSNSVLSRFIFAMFDARNISLIETPFASSKLLILLL